MRIPRTILSAVAVGFTLLLPAGPASATAVLDCGDGAFMQYASAPEQLTTAPAVPALVDGVEVGYSTGPATCAGFASGRQISAGPYFTGGSFTSYPVTVFRYVLLYDERPVPAAALTFMGVEAAGPSGGSDLLGGADSGLWSGLGSAMHHPLMALGFPLAAASIAMGLVLRWVRRAAVA